MAGNKIKQKEITIGTIFGRLQVISFKSIKTYNLKSSKNTYKRKFWECVCSCGTVVSVQGSNLVSGNTTSCGCLTKENTSKVKKTHGMTNSRIWIIWRNMRNRCDSVTNTAYNRYGGRGISYQSSWADFEAFLSDMAEGYSDNLTLDRIDNNGNYTKENCRWATYSVQGFNQRKRITNTSGRTGVYWNKKNSTWEAKICVDGKLLSLYSGESFEEAVRYREQAELHYFGIIKEEDKI